MVCRRGVLFFINNNCLMSEFKEILPEDGLIRLINVEFLQSTPRINNLTPSNTAHKPISLIQSQSTTCTLFIGLSALLEPSMYLLNNLFFGFLQNNLKLFGNRIYAKRSVCNIYLYRLYWRTAGVNYFLIYNHLLH